ncbi:MAG: hypothetical protein IKN50_06545, partial [Clostridia bacterium]|nr:hypothetical protein [Clostridia bacterium]
MKPDSFGRINELLKKGSSNITKEQLKDFDSEGDTLGDFEFLLSYEGSDYYCTVPEGVSDPAPSDYGQEKITYQVEDETLYSDDGTQFTEDEYQFTALSLGGTYFSDVSYDSVKNSFLISPFVAVPGDIAEIWVKSSVDGLYHHAADYDYYSKSFTFTDPAFVTSVRGKKVNFVNDSSFRCVGFRVSMAHAHYSTCFEIRAAVSLNFVEGLTEAKTEDREYLNVTNYAYGSMTRSNGDHIAHDIAYGTARTLIDLPEISIAKSYEGFFNDVTHFIYKADWKVAATENHTDTASSGGVIFDLLPVRTTLVKDVNVADGCGIEAKAGTKKLVCGSDYTVEEYYNYNNTGRTLIVVRFNEIASRYEISYSTEITWDNIKDYGPVLHNVAAYKSGNTIVKNGVNGISGPIDLSAVDENASSELFTYTTNDHTIRIPLSGQLGLYKQVSGLSTQSSSTTVYNGGYYEYDIRFSTDPASRAKDLILYDSLENYVIKRQPYGEDIPSDWHGKLTSVDVSRLIHLGIDPVIYYSTVPDLDVETHTDLSDGSVWSTAVDDIGEVTAIAIDARRKTDGTEYVLPPDSAVSVILRMQAPDYIE